jgi:hypothetical protein
MKNSKELRDEMSKVFSQVRAGTMKPQTASTLANISGRMIQSASTQVQYYKQRNEIPSIPFLDEK